MTYRLDPEVRKITSPIILSFSGGREDERFQVRRSRSTSSKRFVTGTVRWSLRTPWNPWHAYKGRQTGTFGAYNYISFNGNKIIADSTGGMLLTDNPEAGRFSIGSTERGAADEFKIYVHHKPA